MKAGRRAAKPRGRAKGIFAVEVFSGSSHLGKAWLRRGWTFSSWDWIWGDSFDLTRPDNVRRLLAEVGRAKWVHLGTPCTTCSRARRGKHGRADGPLRSKAHPWGLPGLPQELREQLRVGNKLIRVSLAVIDLCCRLGIPVSMENPRSSFLWSLPAVRARLRRPGADLISLDYCAYGTAWQKGTRFATWNADLSSLSRRCGRRDGICGWTGRKHWVLEGPCPGGGRMTKLAEPYPRALCTAYADAADAQLATAGHDYWKATYIGPGR